MNARSALFDLYGDHLLARGGAAPVASLVRLLAPLDIAAPAVRTAVSRMVAQGWLRPERLTQGPGYRLTPRAEDRLSAAAARVYRTDSPPWDGRWHVLVLDHIADRARRERVRSALGYLGYARLRDPTWISPRPSRELAALLDAEGITAHQFDAALVGDDALLAADAWDLDALAAAYRDWQRQASALLARLPRQPSDAAAFVTRTRLVHEWRKFLFTDPGLPREVLPADWPGDAAAAQFDAESSRLLPQAASYVEGCLGLT